MRPLLPALLLVSLAGAEPAPDRATESHSRLGDLAFMAGCWRGASGGGATIDEYYTPPSENLMLGVSRYTKGGKVSSYEFTTIASRGDSDLVLTPRPSGQSPVDFSLAKLEPGSATWSNPKHDFPQVIAYRRLGKDSLVARIEGPGSGGPRSSEWRMGKVPCSE
jgi:Domain of unknown function (DUF6265)